MKLIQQAVHLHHRSTGKFRNILYHFSNQQHFHASLFTKSFRLANNFVHWIIKNLEIIGFFCKDCYSKRPYSIDLSLILCSWVSVRVYVSCVRFFSISMEYKHIPLLSHTYLQSDCTFVTWIIWERKAKVFPKLKFDGHEFSNRRIYIYIFWEWEGELHCS